MQSQYSLSKEANAALFELLQSNYDQEILKRQQTTRANTSQQTFMVEDDRIDPEDSESLEYTSHFQKESEVTGTDPSAVASESDDDNCDVPEDKCDQESDRARF